jgi:hypothetical protein
VKRILKNFNFKKRKADKLLKNFKTYKYETYMELYKNKLLGFKLSRYDVETLEKIEEFTSLTEIMYLRNLVMEKLMVNKVLVPMRKTDHNSTQPGYKKSTNWLSLEHLGGYTFQLSLHLQDLEVGIRDSALVEMNRQINTILEANSHRDESDPKLSQKIRETTSKYLYEQAPVLSASSAQAERSKRHPEQPNRPKESGGSGSDLVLKLKISSMDVDYLASDSAESKLEMAFSDLALRDQDEANIHHSLILGIKNRSRVLVFNSDVIVNNLGVRQSSMLNVEAKFGEMIVAVSNDTFNRLCKVPLKV